MILFCLIFKIMIYEIYLYVPNLILIIWMLLKIYFSHFPNIYKSKFEKNLRLLFELFIKFN